MYFASLIKSAISAIYVYVTFVVCCLPYFISEAVIERNRPNIAFTGDFRFSHCITLIRLNSSLNPLIYRRCWTMRHIRHAIISLRSKHSRTTRTKMQPEYEKTSFARPEFRSRGTGTLATLSWAYCGTCLGSKILHHKFILGPAESALPFIPHIFCCYCR